LACGGELTDPHFLRATLPKIPDFSFAHGHLLVGAAGDGELVYGQPALVDSGGRSAVLNALDLWFGGASPKPAIDHAVWNNFFLNGILIWIQNRDLPMVIPSQPHARHP